jgi:phytoene/squalene synthetase
METDLYAQVHDRYSFDKYILGSAEVVGLMCLRVFTNGNQRNYDLLRPYAMRLGSAFQKVNFLRDIRADYEQLGRVYFPDVSFVSFSDEAKYKIECEIQDDFEIAMNGIRQLPSGARLGVYVAYLYYRALFTKIRSMPARRILKQRIRISNRRKLWLMCAGLIRHNLGFL